MKTLWFKNEFVDPILTGKKTHTVRKEASRLPVVGERVALSVGPRAPFALAIIIAREPIDLERLSALKRREMEKCYPDGITVSLIRLSFRLL